MENFVIGFYLKASNAFRLGQKVKIDDVDGTIKTISNQGGNNKN